MTSCFFVTDLHGKKANFDKLFREIQMDEPDIVFNGGDILPHTFRQSNFIQEHLFDYHIMLKELMEKSYPEFLYIMGNDDPKSQEKYLIEGDSSGLWNYISKKVIKLNGYEIAGYPYIPPSPFLLKDWEKYDVSRYVDPGCVHPSEGIYSLDPDIHDKQHSTIADDLKSLSENADIEKFILMSHCPPYQTKLDMIVPKGRIEGIEPDPHVGSIAIKNFIEKQQPYLTLHGHIHESCRLSGEWKEQIGKTICINGASDSQSLVITKFELEDLSTIDRTTL